MRLEKIKRCFLQANIISLVFNILFNLPIALYKPCFYKMPVFYSSFLISLLIELFIVFLINNLLFFLLLCSGLFLRFIPRILIYFLFIISSIATYFLISYKKIVDAGVIIDTLSVEHELITDYINFRLLLVVFLATIISIALIKLIKTSYLQKYLKLFVKINFVPLIIFLIFIFFNSGQVFRLNFISRDYLPYNIINNCWKCYFKYLPQLKQKEDKIDLSLKYKPKLLKNDEQPKVIVLVIGESMRGDLISINGYELNNMPLIEKIPNLISFVDAVSSSTSTRVSIPYMLTSATPPNFDQALSELSIISMFKSLGFATSWIGSQGAFSEYETTYASIILEADYFVFKPQIKESIKTRNNYDGDLLPFIKARLNSVKGNHFMIVHFIGSHWHFNERYPKDFPEKFLPTCKSKDRELCTHEMIMNSYHNTILYTDYVLSEIIAYLKPLNSFLLYASDHGFSFGEKEEFFGNAYSGENIPHSQLHIGMFVWVSDIYIKNNPNNYHNILLKKYDRISHDYIYHSLLDCNNITSEIIEPKFDLCMPSK